MFPPQWLFEEEVEGTWEEVVLPKLNPLKEFNPPNPLLDWLGNWVIEPFLIGTEEEELLVANKDKISAFESFLEACTGGERGELKSKSNKPELAVEEGGGGGGAAAEVATWTREGGAVVIVGGDKAEDLIGAEEKLEEDEEEEGGPANKSIGDERFLVWLDVIIRAAGVEVDGRDVAVADGGCTSCLNWMKNIRLRI